MWPKANDQVYGLNNICVQVLPGTSSFSALAPHHSLLPALAPLLRLLLQLPPFDSASLPSSWLFLIIIQGYYVHMRSQVMMRRYTDELRQPLPRPLAACFAAFSIRPFAFSCRCCSNRRTLSSTCSPMSSSWPFKASLGGGIASTASFACPSCSENIDSQEPAGACYFRACCFCFASAFVAITGSCQCVVCAR